MAFSLAVVVSASQTVKASGCESHKAKESGDNRVRLADTAVGGSS